MIINRQLVAHKNSAITDLISSVCIGLVFVSGIGRYRLVLVYAAFCLIKSIISYVNTTQKVQYILLPATIIAIYFDIIKGPLLPIFQLNSLIIAIPIMIIIDVLVRRISKRLINKLTEGQLFVICPSCKYTNADLVCKCANCSYEYGNKLAGSTQNINNSKLPFKVICMIGLGDNEVILFFMKIFPFKSITKNGEKQVREYLIITASNVIFLDYPYFSSSWREKDIIPITDVVSITSRMKKIYASEEPFLEITSSKDVYEIAFNKFGNYKKECSAVAEAISKVNPQVNIRSDLSVISSYLDCG